ncbi:hypothetical protein [Streptomyces sp. NPDC019224]|uniref:hypothetical protein n=1 Tax=Streptomyces sp. NPDC019224 TaxID=3154484 RepID=UPI0033FBD255
MTTSADLLLTAAASMGGAMGTELWKPALKSLVTFRRRRHGGAAEGETETVARLDSLEQVVAAAEPDQRQAMINAVEPQVREILASCVGDEPDTIQELIDALKAQGVEPPADVSVKQDVKNNLVFGNQNVAGRDNNFGGAR